MELVVAVELVVVVELQDKNWRMIQLVGVAVVEGTALMDFGHDWGAM